MCEEQWRGLLDAVATGKLRPNREKPRYVADPANRFRYPNDFYQALRSRRWYQVPTIQTSLGCPYACSFCSAYMQGKYIVRGIQTIYNEVASVPGRIVFFSDASFGLNKRFTVELMRALAPLKKKIAVETTLARLRDEQMLEALAAGGVKWLIVGIETLGSRLRKHGSLDLHASLRQLVGRVHELGLLIQGNFICGLDGDGPESFEHIYECCDRSNLDASMIGILTPYPDTLLYCQLETEGRILDRDWEHYDGYHVVYRPRRMTADQLIEGYIGLYRKLGKRKSVLREAIEHVGNHGIGPESLVMIGHSLYRRLDAIQKKRLLRENQGQLAQLSL
jgi:radical SAM superfamily enzyme YgiQ (UPF0313 family)